jgi:hypothetical protein
VLTQSEADALIVLQKKRATDTSYDFPKRGETLAIPILSMDERESFLLDISRGRIRLTKCTYQERYGGIIILVRLDIDGQPHTNPEVSSVPVAYLASHNGATLPCPHLHVYVEGFMDKWAIPAPPDKFPKIDDIHSTLDDFFRYCNIIQAPIIQRELFNDL